ncbi:MAG: hypothetical protein WDN46_10065 [Methylocella sp.]
MDDLRKRLATALGRRIPFVRPDYDLNLRRDVELGLADAALAIIEPELAAIRQSTLEAVREKAGLFHRNEAESLRKTASKNPPGEGRLALVYKAAEHIEYAEAIEKLELGE